MPSRRGSPRARRPRSPADRRAPAVARPTTGGRPGCPCTRARAARRPGSRGRRRPRRRRPPRAEQGALLVAPAHRVDQCAAEGEQRACVHDPVAARRRLGAGLAQEAQPCSTAPALTAAAPASRCALAATRLPATGWPSTCGAANGGRRLEAELAPKQTPERISAAATSPSSPLRRGVRASTIGLGYGQPHRSDPSVAHALGAQTMSPGCGAPKAVRRMPRERMLRWPSRLGLRDARGVPNPRGTERNRRHRGEVMRSERAGLQVFCGRIARAAAP
jgi:hypothetical protein